MIARTFASVCPRQSPSSLIFWSMNAEADSIETLLIMCSSNSRTYFNCAQAVRSVGASPAAPLGSIRQHEQVQTGDQEQGEREHRQETQPIGIPLQYHGDDVDDDGHRKGNGQPAVDLPNPFVPVQWD